MFYLLIVIAAASRFLPHPPNVACVTALGLFAGCYLSGSRAYLVPLAVLAGSDLLGHSLGIPGMGLYSPLAMGFVYAGTVAAVPVGRWIAKRQGKLRVISGALLASCLFFLVSNLGVWAAGWYPMTGAGLAACFTNAIPFFGYSVVGDLCFSMLLFGAWEWAGVESRLQRPVPVSSRLRL
ncbi:MAG: hypothetical protein CMM01_22850 [Rhodopirellula sp.]|nr:hypothetical protein [Rhodopirellula sp.]